MPSFPATSSERLRCIARKGTVPPDSSTRLKHRGVTFPIISPSNFWRNLSTRASHAFHAVDGYTVSRSFTSGRERQETATWATQIMIEKPRVYLAYMLRIWSLRNSGKTLWRASVENAQTGERRGFASLDDLFEYLQSQAAAMSEPKTLEKKKTDRQE